MIWNHSLIYSYSLKTVQFPQYKQTQTVNTISAILEFLTKHLLGFSRRCIKTLRLLRSNWSCSDPNITWPLRDLV